jgi:RHS repeat-associated protein
VSGTNSTHSALHSSYAACRTPPRNSSTIAPHSVCSNSSNAAAGCTPSKTRWSKNKRTSAEPSASKTPKVSVVVSGESTYYYDARTFAADGTPTSGEETVHSGAGVETWDLSRGVDGSVLATWTAADSSGFGIWAAVRDPGGTWGSDFLIPAVTIYNQEYESTAALADGGWVVAWQDSTNDGDGSGLFARRVAVDGTPVGDDVQINATTTGDQTAVRLAAVPGGVAAVWVSDGQDGDRLGVYARHYLFTAENRMDYDDRSRLVRSIDPLGNVTLFGYDEASNLTSVIDPLGHQSTATFDEMHRPLTTIDALSGETDYDYDDAGNLYTLTDPDGNATTYAVRDGLNRVLTETDPNSNDTNYVYDGNGNLLSVTDRDGRVRTFDYDLVGNRADEVWWDGVSDIYEADYTYDLADQLLTASDDNSSFTYTYDVLGQLETEEQTFGPVMVDFTYGYDATGNRTSVSDGTAEVDSTYTDADQLYTLGMSVSSVLGPNLTFGYDAANRLASIGRQEGASGDTIDSAYGYDAASRLIDIAHSSSNAGALNEFTYGYDVANRLMTYSGPEGDREYGYDDTNQLTSVTDPSGPTTLESFMFDANGNRLTSGATTYGTPDPGNRMTSDGTYSYAYDDNGNTIVKAKSGERWEYTYDLRNRLTEVKELTGLAGTVLYDAQYTYDVFDRRVGILEDADGAGGGAAVQTWSVYDGANTWGDYDHGGTQTMRYLNGNGMDERYARVTAGGTVSWYLTDNINSVRQIVHTDGTEVYSASYTAFGTIVSPSGVGGDRFKFTGREWDAGTATYYYRARNYGGDTGRFASEDPKWFLAGDTNGYRYAENCVAQRKDPTGLSWLGTGIQSGMGAVCGGMYGTTYQGVAFLMGNKWNGKFIAVTAAKEAGAFAAGELAAEKIVGSTAADGESVAISLEELVAVTVIGAVGGAIDGAVDSPYDEQRSIHNIGSVLDALGLIPKNGDGKPGKDKCFVAGTPVHTASGLRSIEQVSAGDEVWTWNENSRCFEVKKVITTYSGDAVNLVRISGEGWSMVCTPKHRVLANSFEWIRAESLSVGIELCARSTVGQAVRSIQSVTASEPVKVYNLTVADNHNYCVANAGIVAHNFK